MEIFGFVLPVTGKLSLIPRKMVMDGLFDDTISTEKRRWNLKVSYGFKLAECR
jgi:hypothetical protein